MMIKGRPDVFLYKLNALVVLALSISVSGLYWYAWKKHTSIDVGPTIIGFHAQTFLTLDFASYLAKELERTLTALLMFSVPIIGVTSLFCIRRDYEILWWSHVKTESVRARLYGFLILILGSFSSFYLSTDVSDLILRSLPLANDDQKFIIVGLSTAVFFAVVSTAMLVGVVGFVNAFERSINERKKK